MLNNMYITVCNMSITAVFVILLVITLRVFLKKSSRSVVYYLWGIVGFRLLCPFSISSVISLFNLPVLRNYSVTGNELNWQQTADLSVPYVWNIQAPGAEPVVESIIIDGVKEELLYDPQPLFSIGVTDVKAFLWIAVCVLILAYQVYSCLKLKRTLQMAVKVEDNIYECDKIQGPFVLGFFRPRIYIPFHLQEEERDFVLEHERYHIKRHDYQAKILAIILLAVHWFNPFVWIAYYLFCKDMEISCDEYVIKKLGTDKKQDYSNTLLAFATGRKRWALGTLAFGETSVFERVQSILKFKKPGKIVFAIAICCSALIAILGLTNGQKDNIIKKVGKDEEGSIKYNYQFSDEISSFLIYKEFYRCGELEEYEVIMYADFQEDDFEKNGVVSIKQGNVNGENNEQDMALIIKSDGLEVANQTETGKYGYQAVAPMFYLQDSVGWESIGPEEEIVVAAFNLDDGTGVRGYSCEAYQDSDIKPQLVMDNPGVVLYHLVCSEKEVDELREHYERPSDIVDLYNAKNPYIGDHIADGNTLRVLGVPAVGNYTMELQTSEEPYGITLHFDKYPIDEVEFHEKMLKRAAKFLTVTENAGYFEWTYPDVNGTGTTERRYSVKEIEQMLGISDLKAYAQSEDMLQELCKKIDYSDWAIAEAEYVCQSVEYATDGPLHICISAEEIHGYVLCEQVKMIDIRVRGYKKIGRINLGDKINIADAIQGMFEYV